MNKSRIAHTIIFTTALLSAGAQACEWVDVDPYNVAATPAKLTAYALDSIERGDLAGAQDWLAAAVALDGGPPAQREAARYAQHGTGR